MNLYKHIVALGALTVITALPAAAQVEKVAIKTTGISCGTCAAVSEVYLRRLPSIDKINPMSESPKSRSALAAASRSRPASDSSLPAKTSFF